MRVFILLLILGLSFLGSTQIQISKTKHDFGDIESFSVRHIDFAFKNIGNKQEWILRVQKPQEVVYLVDKQIIEKGESTTLRFQVNPSRKGRFNYQILVYLSDRNDPVRLKLTGNYVENPNASSNYLTSCPDFSTQAAGTNPLEFDLTVITIDKETRELLSSSEVILLQNGVPVWKEKTDKNGRIKEKALIGLSYFYATHDGYDPTEKGAYINFERNKVTLELERKPDVEQEVIVEVEPEQEMEQEEEENVIVIEEEIEEEETPAKEEIVELIPEEVVEEVDSVSEERIPSLEELDKENFDDQYFEPINVVFILDVSSSMKHADKMSLMKYALLELSKMLRPQDKFSIVTYASDAKVLLPPTSGENKEVIEERIKALKAFGFTAGGTGIKLGYKTAWRSRIKNGVNHVIVITDGAFNRNSEDYEKHIKKYKRKGITMSVVGIQIKSGDAEKMRQVAELGNGRLVQIMRLADAKNGLKQEIRRRSYKF